MIRFQLIVPPVFNEEAINRELRKEASEIQAEVKKDFEETVGTWSSKPEFVGEESSGDLINFSVKTTDALYAMIVKGTAPHTIFLQAGKKAFKLKGGAFPKTSPGVLGSTTGGFISDDFVRKPFVPHPGTEARGFDDVIVDKWAKPILQRLQEAMDRGARRSGHFVR